MFCVNVNISKIKLTQFSPIQYIHDMVKHAALVSNKVPIIHGNRKISYAYQTIRSEAIG